MAKAPTVSGLVLVVDHVDLGAGCRPHDLRGDLVAADLRGVADDLVVVYDQHGGQRHAGADLTGELVNRQDIVDRCLLLPATAAHDRVHRELSLPYAGPPRDPRLRSSSIDAHWPACVAHCPAPSVLPPACPTRRPQRISDIQASACCRLSLLPATLVAAAMRLVTALPDAVLGRFVLPRAIRLLLGAAHGLGARIRLRLVTGDRAARIWGHRLTMSG